MGFVLEKWLRKLDCACDEMAVSEERDTQMDAQERYYTYMAEQYNKQKGEGQDISGDYNTYEFCDKQNVNGGTVTSWHNSDNDAVKQIVSYGGYSWSLVASDGWWGDANQDFLNCVWESAG